MYPRTISKIIKRISDTFPVLLVTGPRQVGKTTLLKMCSEGKYNYVTLDDLSARAMALNDPGLFMQTYKPPLIIDEIQYAPQLMSYIKIIVDKEQQNGMFWLTGSQKFHLMKGITESLAGRVAIIDLLGFSLAEIEYRSEFSKQFLPTQEWLIHAQRDLRAIKQMDAIYKQIWLGSFPKLVNEVKESDFAVDENDIVIIRDNFYSSYIQTYIQRDVRDILNIANETTFYNFLCSIAARTGQLLNYNDVSRDIGIDNKTVKSWLSILETSGLIYLLHPYYRNINKRIIKTPKLYFLDTGLCTYLTQWPTSLSLSKGAMSGAILETFVFSEILKSYFYNGIRPNFHYYRDVDQKEIDLVIETADSFYPMECKRTSTPTLKGTKNFDVLSKLGKKVGHGVVLCFVEKMMPISRNVTAIPIGYL